MGKNKYQIILQWNCRGFWANFEELKHICHDLKPSVVCLQEIRLAASAKSNIKGFSSYHVSSTSVDGIPIGGSSILIENSISHQRITLRTELQAVAVRVSLAHTITICSIYLPPRTPFETSLQEHLLNNQTLTK